MDCMTYSQFIHFIFEVLGWFAVFGYIGMAYVIYRIRKG